MASRGFKYVYTDQDYTHAKIVGLAAASAAGHPVEYSQLNASLAGKQYNIIDSTSIHAQPDHTLNVVLADVTGDRGTATFSAAGGGLPYNGVYTRSPINGYFVYSGGYVLDATAGAGHAIFYRDNGGFLDIIAWDQPNDNWHAWTTAAVSVDQLVHGYNVGNSPVRFPFTQDEEVVNGVTYALDVADIAYSAATASVSYLKITTDGLSVDTVTDLGLAVSTKMATALAIKNYVDNGLSLQNAADQITYSDTYLGLGVAGNVQAAIDGLGDVVAGNTTDIATNGNSIVNQAGDHAHLLNAVGSIGFQDHMGVMGHEAFTDNTTVKALLVEAADYGAAKGANVYTDLGTVESDVGIGSTSSTIFTSDVTYKAAIEAVGSQVEANSLGLGSFWTVVEGHDHDNVVVANPATDDFDGYTASQGDRILLVGQTDPAENGIYIFDTTSTPLVRAADANADAQFTANKTVQESSTGDIYAYAGASDPVVGTDALVFTKKSASVVGDGSITEAKLHTTLAAKVNSKVDKVIETGTVLVADTGYDVVHTLGLCQVVVVDDTGNDITAQVEIDHNRPTYDTVTVTSSFGVTVDILLIG